MLYLCLNVTTNAPYRVIITNLAILSEIKKQKKEKKRKRKGIRPGERKKEKKIFARYKQDFTESTAIKYY